MKVRNNYGPIAEDGSGALAEWWTVEEEPGIAVGGDDYRFDFESETEAEQVAKSLAPMCNTRLTVVKHIRIECRSFQAKTIVEEV